jgi:hypothetical protein
LTLHFESGITLTAGKYAEEGDKAPQVIWFYPYERLRMSADDGHRLLWLDFGEDGEHVSEPPPLSLPK